jgi:hypothetical protein
MLIFSLKSCNTRQHTSKYIYSFKKGRGCKGEEREGEWEWQGKVRERRGKREENMGTDKGVALT